MNTSTASLPRDLLRPRTLTVLMGMYERNYERLVQLLGEPEGVPMQRRIPLAGRPELHVEVRGRSRYTLDLLLTHRFAGESLPDLVVRLYRDARLAEALPVSRRHQPGRPFARMPERWRANMLLYKWLEYCLESAAEPEGEPA